MFEFNLNHLRMLGYYVGFPLKYNDLYTLA